MAKVITFSRQFPSYHPKAGQPTLFVEKLWNSLLNQNIDTVSDYIYDVGEKLGYRYADDALHKVDNVKPKHHTIRGGNRWKVGDKFSPRIWSGKPYNSKQIILADDVEVKKVFEFVIERPGYILNGYAITLTELKILAENDGLEADDLELWFNKSGKFQVICWNENLQYKMSDGKFIF